MQSLKLITDTHKPHVQIRGSVKWSCPSCGVINRSMLQVTSNRLVCKNRGCRAVYRFGGILWDMGKVRGSAMRRPIDVTFPEVPLAQWEHDQVHVNLVAEP